MFAFPYHRIRFILVSFCLLGLQGFNGSIYAQTLADSIELERRMERVNTHYASGEYEQALVAMRSSWPIIQRYKTSQPDKIGNYYRSVGHCHAGLSQYDSAIVYGRRAWENFRTSLGDSNRYTIDVHYELGYLFHQIFSYDSALLHYQGSLGEYERYIGTETDDVPLTLHQIAMIYQDLGLSEDALSFEKRAYELWEALKGPNSKRMLTATRAVGGMYKNVGESEQAVIYARKAYDIVQNLYASEPVQQADQAIRLAAIYRDLGQDSLWLDWLDTGQQLLEKAAKRDHMQYAWIYSGRAKYYRKHKQFDRAIAYMSQAAREIEPFAQQQALGKIYQGDFFLQLAQILIEAGELEEVEANIDKAYERYVSTYPKRIFYTTYERAHLAFEQGDSSTVFTLIPKLIGDIEAAHAAPSAAAAFEASLNTYPESRSLTVLLRQADWLWTYYDQFGRDRYLQLATAAFEQLDRWYDPVQNHRVQPSREMATFRQWINKGLMRCYEAYFQKTGDLHFLEKAFEAAEYNNSFALYNHVRHQQDVQFAGVPDSLVRRESELRAQLAYLSSRFMNANGQSGNLIADQRLQELQLSYESLLEHIDQTYPAYFSLLAQKPVSLKQFQAMLRPQQAALVLVPADSIIYRFILTADLATCSAVSLPADFETQVQQYHSLLTDYPAYLDSPEELSSQIAAEGYDLYQVLLGSALTSLPTHTTDLLLIPGSTLSHIPFEALLTAVPEKTNGSFAEFPFLLQSYDLMYGYSASLYWDQHQMDRARRASGLATFAPSYQDQFLTSLPETEQQHMAMLVREGWYDLKGAQDEARAIASLWEGDVFLADAASKSQFLQAAPAYKLLHLAMHTSVQPQNPMLSSLIFSPAESEVDTTRKLFAAELFAMKLQAEMVVLSGCNTGYESEESGLGNFSLAKAFQYAGSPSVIMSLWKVPDVSTRQLMLNFYEELKDGQQKSSALRHAKINYLQNVLSPEQTHPIYWAGFVASGNNEPITEASFPLWPIFLLITALVACVIWIRSRRKQL